MTTKAEIEKATAKIIEDLFSDGKGHPAELAALRAAASLEAHQAHRIWPLLARYWSAPMIDKRGEITAEILAIYTAVRLYAIYQQGKYNPATRRLLPVVGLEDQDGQSLMAVLAEVRQVEKIRAGLDRRMTHLLAAPNLSFVDNSLVRLIRIVKAQERTFKIDYPAIASDLWFFQKGYASANRIRFKWGSEYYYRQSKDEENHS